MRNRKLAAFILVIICMMMIPGCAKGEKKKSNIPEIGSGDVAEKDPDIVTFEDGQQGEDQKTPAFILKKEDADNLISEELSGSGCSAEYKESLEIDGNGYYTYTVKDPDGKEMDRMLAVDGFSGDVKVFDSGLKKISDFSEFPYYDKTDRKFKDISWDGQFAKGDISIELLPADDTSFEFTVNEKDKELLSGVAFVEKDEARFESEDKKETLVLKMTGPGELKVTESGDLKISGEYKRK